MPGRAFGKIIASATSAPRRRNLLSQSRTSTAGGLRAIPKFQDVSVRDIPNRQGTTWVKLRKSHREQILSALPPSATVTAVGSVIAVSHPRYLIGRDGPVMSPPPGFVVLLAADCRVDTDSSAGVPKPDRLFHPTAPGDLHRPGFEPRPFACQLAML